MVKSRHIKIKNICQYPEEFLLIQQKLPEDNDNQSITFGDMHANALCMLHKLIITGIIEINEKDYNDFAAIYKIQVEKLKKENIDSFNKIVERITLGNNVGILVRFLGDMLADRGNNDYFILKLLDRLRRLNVKYEIVLSNHDVVFMDSYFNHGYLAPTSDNLAYRNRNISPYRSLKGTCILIKKKVITKEEIDKLYTDNSLHKTKLLSYEFNEHDAEFILFSHAPITLSAIIQYAKGCIKVGSLKSEGLVFHYDRKKYTITDIMKIIDAFNNHFQIGIQNKSNFIRYIKKGKNQLKVPRNSSGKSDGCCRNSNNSQSYDSIYAHTILNYNRKVGNENFSFKVKYVHAHCGEQDSNIIKKDNMKMINIDVDVGKGLSESYMKGDFAYELGNAKAEVISKKEAKNILFNELKKYKRTTLLRFMGLDNKLFTAFSRFSRRRKLNKQLKNNYSVEHVLAKINEAIENSIKDDIKENNRFYRKYWPFSMFFKKRNSSKFRRNLECAKFKIFEKFSEKLCNPGDTNKLLVEEEKKLWRCKIDLHMQNYGNNKNKRTDLEKVRLALKPAEKKINSGDSTNDNNIINSIAKTDQAGTNSFILLQRLVQTKSNFDVNSKKTINIKNKVGSDCFSGENSLSKISNRTTL